MAPAPAPAQADIAKILSSVFRETLTKVFPQQNGMMEGLSEPEIRAMALNCCEQTFTVVAGIPRVKMLVLDAAGAVSTQMVAADSGSTFTAATRSSSATAGHAPRDRSRSAADTQN